MPILKSPWKRKFVVALSVTAAISILLTLVVVRSGSNVVDALSQIRSSADNGDFDQARQLLSAFLKDHDNNRELDQLGDLISRGETWAEAFESAQGAEASGDFLEAVRQYRSIPPED